MVIPIYHIGSQSPVIVWMAPMVPYFHRISLQNVSCTSMTRTCVVSYHWCLRRKWSLKPMWLVSVSPRHRMFLPIFKIIRRILVIVRQDLHPVLRMDCLMSLCVNMVRSPSILPLLLLIPWFDWSLLDSCHVMNVCVLDSPIMLSFPHFYLADESLRVAVEGISPPDKEKHQFFIDVNPVCFNFSRFVGRVWF